MCIRDREKAFEWMADEREYFQLCGFMLMARLLMKGNQLTERSEAEFLDQAMAVSYTHLVAECFYCCRLLGGDQVQSLVG